MEGLGQVGAARERRDSAGAERPWTERPQSREALQRASEAEAPEQRGPRAEWSSGHGHSRGAPWDS